MSISQFLPLRNDLLHEEPYGAPQLDVTACLNVNENPYSLDEDVAKDIAQEILAIAPTLNRYPDRDHTALREDLAKYLREESGVEVEYENVWAANGSNEIMLQLFQAFGGPGRIALSADPTYSMYPEYARDTFTQWKTVERNSDFSINIEKFIAAVEEEKPSLIVLTSPNNPTGTLLDNADIARILQATQNVEVAGSIQSAHPLVVIDEAYAEFRDPQVPSALELLEHYPNIAISRTMSKAFAFAGVRLGYLAAHPDVIQCMQIVRLPYHLSALTQAAARVALRHTKEQLAQVAHLRQLREDTQEWLSQQTYKGHTLHVAPSQSNFVLFGGDFDNRDRIFSLLVERGVLIRVVGPQGWLRVCMGTDEEMALFRKSLLEVLRIVENEN